MTDDVATALVPLRREDDPAAELLDLLRSCRDIVDAGGEDRVRREARATADPTGDRAGIRDRVVIEYPVGAEIASATGAPAGASQPNSAALNARSRSGSGR